MEREGRYMPDGTPPGTGPETGGTPPAEATTATPESGFRITPEFRRRFLEQNDLEHLQDDDADKVIRTILEHQQPGKEKPLQEGRHYETIKNQFLQDVEVEWANDRGDAEKQIRDILGEIEIAKEDVDQQIQIDYKNALDVLEVLSRKESDLDWTKKPPVPLSKAEVEDQREWAKTMRKEIKARLKMHGSFLKYENGSSIKDVKEAMVGLYGGWLNIIFELKEKSKIPGESEKTFNPFVEAMQYYEDHGHEFARHNSEVDRPVFGKRVAEDLQKRFGGEAKDYKWAQNMAERLFRSTGRAMMFDYLVINKDKPNERMVTWDYDGPEKAEWAGGRDGCDYSMSKIYRFRENMKAEEGLMRGQIQLLDGADIMAGDFWTRTMRESNIIIPGESKPLITYRNADQNAVDHRIQISEQRLKEQYLFEGLSEEKARENIDKAINGEKGIRKMNTVLIGSALEQERDEIIERRRTELRALVPIDIKISELLSKQGNTLTEEQARQKIEDDYKEEAKRYYEEIYAANITSDRPDDNNFGEIVGHIDFRLMQRDIGQVLKEDGTKEDVLISGIDFHKMGTTPMGLWVTRMLDGPETAKDPLSGSREAFLLNPNFKTLGKLLSVFDYSKANTFKIKEQLIKNYIKFATSDAIEATGRRKLTDAEIIAGVNELAGYTDPNAPQFIQPEERTRILMDYLNIKITDEEKAKMDQQAKDQAEKQIGEESPELSKDSEEFKEKIKNRTLKIKNKLVNIMINSRIEHRQNTEFAKSFTGNFVVGGVIGGVKQALAELGVK